MLMANLLLRHERRSDGTSVSEQLCTLPVDEQGRNDCAPASREHQLEEGPTAGQGGQTPSATSMSFPLENSDSTSHQAEGEQVGRPCLDLKHQISIVMQDGSWPFQVWNHASKHLELDGKKPSIPMAELLNQLELDSPPIGTALTSGQVPFSPEQEQGGSRNSLEARNRCEELQTSSTTSRTDGELGMAIDLTADQTAPFDSEQISRRAHEIHEAEVNRLQLCYNLMALTLVNDDVQCYVNTVFITVFWTHLLCSDFVINTWVLTPVG